MLFLRDFLAKAPFEDWKTAEIMLYYWLNAKLIPCGPVSGTGSQDETGYGTSKNAAESLDTDSGI